MEAFVMWVTLAADHAPVAIPVQDCKEMRTWLIDARAWQRRAGIPVLQGPLAVCGPSAVMLSGQSPSFVQSLKRTGPLNVRLWKAN